MAKKLEEYNTQFGKISLFEGEGSGQDDKWRGNYFAFCEKLGAHIGKNSNSMEELRENIYTDLKRYLSQKEEGLSKELNETKDITALLKVYKNRSERSLSCKNWLKDLAEDYQNLQSKTEEVRK